jgi:uncharacterized membrane protein YidH (DUF202 family)
MIARASWLRTAALLSAGAFGVHQLRYLLAYGDGAQHALQSSGHDYLSVVELMIGLVLAMALGQLLRRIAEARLAGRQLGFPALALVCSVALLAIYAGQELLEGLLAAGHGSGLAGVFGGGGWLAMPLALLGGAGVALLSRTAEAAVAAAAQGVRPAAGQPRLRSAPVGVLVVGKSPTLTTSPLARHLAGRAPPALLSI